jgi:uncharacterized repeat protein (TIGR03803 family)
LATAATNIQDAIDAAQAGDEILVTNGVYATGGRAVHGTVTNRVAVTKAVTVRSVNGPAVTRIEGAPEPGGFYGERAIRCVYLASNATLSGFTLTNGHTQWFTTEDDDENPLKQLQGTGGGVWCEPGATVTNCVLVNNRAGHGGGGVYRGRLFNCVLANNGSASSGGGASGSELSSCRVVDNSSDGWGGGVFGCTLFNCILTANYSDQHGGGAASSTLYHCTLVRNDAASGPDSDPSGGGAYACQLYNCIAWDNSDGNHAGGSQFYNSCTAPMPGAGFGNIVQDPAFQDLAGGDYHLRSGSPCIDSGTNLFGLVTADIDGTLRPLDGNGDGIAAFDMGAYESGMVWPPYSRLALQRIATFRLDDDGSSPRSLIEARNGCLYGTTSGSLNAVQATNATVFKLTRPGTMTVLTSFAPGDVPEGLVEAADGNFYCATRRYDPPGSCGSIVRVMPTGERTNIFNFDGTNGCFADDLLADSDGNLYGLVFSTVGDLSAFKLTRSGEFTLLRNHVGRLLLGEDGFLYGTDANGLNVFRLTTGGAVTVLATATNGILSFRALVEGGDGHLYGLARRGFEGKDSVFRLTRSGVLTELLLFNGTNGLYPTVLAAGVDGNLYGLTEAGGPDWVGVHSPGSGTIFQVTPDGTLTTLAQSFPTGPGIELEGMLQSIDGNLYLAPEGADLGLPGIYRLAPRPVLTRVQHAAGRDVVTWSAFAGGAYQLEHLPTLATTNWNALPAIHASAATTTITNDVGAAAQGYYRIRLLP